MDKKAMVEQIGIGYFEIVNLFQKVDDSDYYSVYVQDHRDSSKIFASNTFKESEKAHEYYSLLVQLAKVFSGNEIKDVRYIKSNMHGVAFGTEPEYLDENK